MIYSDAECASLLAKLELLSSRTNAEWIASLDQRKLEELDFHNKCRDRSLATGISADTFEKLQTNNKYYSTVKASRAYVDNWIKNNCSNKIVLDYACGTGTIAIKTANAGARMVVGLDISIISIQNARDDAQRLGIDNIRFIQGDCENTGLPDSCIDVVICSGMLHHLDLTFAFPEIARILKPDGKAFCIEALDYNPLIKIYRMLTPGLRTRWEKSHILSMKDIRFANKFFTVKNIHHWHLFSIFTTPVRNFRFYDQILAVTNFIDSIILRIWPIKLWSWMFTFELHKTTSLNKKHLRP